MSHCGIPRCKLTAVCELPRSEGRSAERVIKVGIKAFRAISFREAVNDEIRSPA